MYKLPQHHRLATGTYKGPKADAEDGLKKRKGAKVRVIKPNKPGQKPIKYRPGGLHRATGTPQSQKIPKSKLRAALSGKYGAAAAKKARLAVNVFHVKPKRKGKRKSR